MAETPNYSGNDLLLQLEVLNLDLYEVRDYIKQVKVLSGTVIPETSRHFLLSDLEKIESNLIEDISRVQNVIHSNSLMNR